MSTSNQSNGKKTMSTNNSASNTPSSTPVSTIVNSSNNPLPVQTPLTNAPKYGTLVPNRIFVGGISANTTEAELLQLFSNYGTVKAAKIIQDRAGVSRGYGFITFESEEEARRLQNEAHADNIVLRERKLNIAPAIKKQPFSRAFDASSPPTIAPGGPTQYFIPAGSVPFYQGGVTYYPPPQAPGDPNTQHQQPSVYQQPAVYPPQSGPPQTAAPYPSLVYPTQPLYMPQQFPYQTVPYDYAYYGNGNAQFVVGGQGTPPPQPPVQGPGSPPRTSCFNPALSYTADTMFYNMPMYGQIEGAPVYPDPLEMANGNGNLNLPEDLYKFPATVQEIDLSIRLQNTNNTPNSTNPDTTRQSSTPVVSLLSLDERQEKDFTAMQSGRRRKSSDHPTPMNNHQRFNSNGFVHAPYPNSNSCYLNVSTSVGGNRFNMQSFPPNNFNTPPPQEYYPSLPFKTPPPNYSINPNQNNNNDRSLWYHNNKRRNADRQRNNSEGFNSALRTASNSSASVVDENRNEEKFRTTTSSNTPPPAPYSPIMQYGVMGNKYNVRNVGNSRSFHGAPKDNLRSQTNTYPSSTTKTFRNRNMPPRKTNLNNNNFGKGDEPSNTPESSHLANSGSKTDGTQPGTVATCTYTRTDLVVETCNVIAGNSTLQNSNVTVVQSNSSSPPSPQISPSSLGSHNFIPPTRRTRRTVRRNTHAGAPLSEIGAGDAPLPSSDVADTCKKLDNLKL